MIILELGVLGLVAPAIVILSLLIQKYLDILTFKLNVERRSFSDKRASKVDEVICGAKSIKFNTLESWMNKMISRIRLSENWRNLKIFLLRGTVNNMMSIVPTLTAVLIFSIYNNTSNKKLSVAKTYSILIIFNMLSYPIMSLILFF